MIKIIIPESEMFNESTEQFINVNKFTLILEHSLISISKWESKWKKSFMASDKTASETLDYIKCMTINKNVPNDVYDRLSEDNINKIKEYINDSMTATTFSKNETNTSHREIVTSELIYYWMISLNIPISFEKWHINRLLTLIRVCNIKNTPPKKMSRNELMSRNSALNSARKKRLNSKG